MTEEVTDAWQPRIGEQVVVCSHKAWASDWVGADGQPCVLWVAGMTALAGGGIDLTLSDEWPLPSDRLFGQGHLTDGFIINRSGDADDVRPLAMRSASNSPTTNGEVERRVLRIEWDDTRPVAAVYQQDDIEVMRCSIATNLTPRAASDDEVERYRLALEEIQRHTVNHWGWVFYVQRLAAEALAKGAE